MPPESRLSNLEVACATYKVYIPETTASLDGYRTWLDATGYGSQHQATLGFKPLGFEPFLLSLQP